MTLQGLMDTLIPEIEQIVSDIFMIGIDGRQKKMKGYPMAIPVAESKIGWDEYDKDMANAEPEDLLYPYFIVRVANVVYEDEAAKANVYVLFAVYDNDKNMRGYRILMNLLERIANHFRTSCVLEQFWCDKEMGIAVQDDEIFPYFFGGIEMKWNIPELIEE